MFSQDFTKKDFKSVNHLFPAGLVAIDLETTGLSPLVDHIIEIAAIKVVGNEVHTFKTLIKPPVSIPDETIKFHGITDNDVKEAPSIAEVLPKLLAFIDGLPIVAHNAKFDCGFLTFAFHKNKISSQNSDVFCSVKAARKTIRGVENYKLSYLTEQLNIPLDNHHRAYDDALACLHLFELCLQKVKDNISLKKEMYSEALIFNMAEFKVCKTMELPEHLRDLKDYARKQKVAFIKYKGGSMKGKKRPIRPVSLLPMPQGNVVYAHCLVSDLYKTFAIRKISSLERPSAEEIKHVLSELEKSRQKR